MRYVDLSSLPWDKNGEILWKDCLNKEIPFVFDDISGTLKVEKVDLRNRKLEVSTGERKGWISFSKLYYSHIEKLFGASPRQFMYKKGQTVNGLFIFDELWENGQRAYRYQCTECGYQGVILQTKLKSGIGCTKKTSHKKAKRETSEQ